MSENIMPSFPAGLMDVNDVANLIRKGEHIIVAGDAALLGKLPRGNWIGGSTPYFMSSKGGECSQNQIFVNSLETPANTHLIRSYDITNLDRICKDGPDNGYTILIMPAFSEVHFHYARNAPNFEDMFIKPIVGWIAGTHLDKKDGPPPQVFDGTQGTSSDDRAVAMHVELPRNFHACVDIINGMHQGNGPAITFPATGFSATMASIDGAEQNFSGFIKRNNVDFKKPLVADYYGAQINVSIRSVDTETGKVEFYAPVFSDTEYRIANGKLPTIAEEEGRNAAFSCNCILNYLYEDLQGKRTAQYTGPMAFGEIAYLLLNQTLVYLTIVQD